MYLLPPPSTHARARTQELWLFFFNAMYSGVYFVYALATNIFTHTHGLIRSYSLNEYEADPRFFLLKAWARRNQHAVFWLQQVCIMYNMRGRHISADKSFTDM